MRRYSVSSVLPLIVALLATAIFFIGGSAMIAFAFIGVIFFASGVFAGLLPVGLICVGTAILFAVKVVRPAWQLVRELD